MDQEQRQPHGPDRRAQVAATDYAWRPDGGGLFSPRQTHLAITAWVHVMGTKMYYTEEPFSLGLEGEEWHSKLPGLVIPTSAMQDGKRVVIVVVHGSDGYGVVSHKEWQHAENALMAASIVLVMLKELDDGI